MGTMALIWLLDTSKIGAYAVREPIRKTTCTPVRVVGKVGGVPVAVAVTAGEGPRLAPNIEIISRGETETAPAGTGLPAVPVWTAVARELAALTTDTMAGRLGSVTVNVVDTGACEGLVAGAGFITERVQTTG